VAEEQPTKSEASATREPTSLMDIRGHWEAEPLSRAWQHPLLIAVAVVVSLVLGGLLHLKEAYWAAFSAVVVMQAQVKPTVSAARDRFLGTAVGALMGWLTALMWHGSVLVLGLALAIGLTACGVLGLKNASRLCGVTICLIALVPAEGPKWSIALNRLIAVSFGIVISVAISLLLHRWLKLRA
jgi:uncharacterized membrane protein YccC